MPQISLYLCGLEVSVPRYPDSSNNNPKYNLVIFFLILLHQSSLLKEEFELFLSFYRWNRLPRVFQTSKCRQNKLILGGDSSSPILTKYSYLAPNQSNLLYQKKILFMSHSNIHVFYIPVLFKLDILNYDV